MSRGGETSISSTDWVRGWDKCLTSLAPSGKVWSDERQAAYLREKIHTNKWSYSWEQGKQGRHSWKMCGKLFRQYVWNSVRKILCSLNMPTCSQPSQHNLIFGASPVIQYGKPIFTIFNFAQRMHKANLGITTTLYCECIYEILKIRLLCI